MNFFEAVFGGAEPKKPDAGMNVWITFEQMSRLRKDPHWFNLTRELLGIEDTTKQDEAAYQLNKSPHLGPAADKILASSLGPRLRAFGVERADVIIGSEKWLEFVGTLK